MSGFFLLWPVIVFAQENASEAELLLLDARQLEREKWFYSLDEAMREPGQVYKLSLQNEKLEFFPPEILQMENLQILNLSYNKLKEIPEEIVSLRKLERLILSHNRLKTLPASLKELLYLRELYLGSNRLTEIPAWIGGLGLLRVLELSFNPLTSYEINLLEKRLPRCEVRH